MMKRLFPHWLSIILFTVCVSNAQAYTSLPELIRRVKPAVVSIITYDAKNEIKITGTGFFVRPGQVITNLHVIENASRVEVRTFDGKGKTYNVRGVAGIDVEGDLALLSVDVPVTRLRNLVLTRAVPDEGEQIFVIGNPLRLEGSVSDGIVAAVREIPGLGKIIQITAPISHGNSGSPVFNMRGEVVGVVSIKVTNGQNISLALASSRVMDLKYGKLRTLDELAALNNENQQDDAQSDWWYRTGLNSLWLGNYESALSSFENSVNKNPTRVEAWIQVGYCKVKQGNNVEAIEAYQRAIRLRPHSFDAFNRLGDAYYFAGSYYEAVAAYKQAVRLRPDLAEGYYNLGMAYLELNEVALARAQGKVLKTIDAELHKKLVQEIQRQKRSG
jgi:tetratricopeptide (TPR) repeat protein